MKTQTQVHNQLALLNHSYPTLYDQLMVTPEQAGEVAKPRRRRRKMKADDANYSSGFRKRKLTEEQVSLLEQNFGDEHKLESERKDRLASELGLDPRQVAVWFQNRRARWKSKKLEEEYSKLKTEHDSAVLEKCHLETQVLKLKEQLHEAEKEIKRLVERLDGAASMSTSTSLSSSFSMEAMELQFFDAFWLDGLENVFYEPGYNDVHGFDWLNF